ncbi:MAG: hypothetical protein H7289_11175 [Mucilaginibacter sp.]|nr:hypothetical protein [Mucilaginibacter sp.]
MKKFAFILAISVAAITVKAQKAIQFKLKFLPNHGYNTTMKMVMNMEMIGMPGAPVKSKKTTAKSAKAKPMLMKMDMTTKLDITTGAVVPNNSFPVTMRYKDMTIKSIVNGKETPMPKNPIIGQVVYGQSEIDGKFQIDSVAGSGANEQMKTAMKTMVNSLQGNVQFPEKPLNIGESFTQEVPVNLPVAGMNLDMKAKSTYKLIAIRANLAYFDMDMTMNFGMDSEKNGGMNMTGNGGGKGKLVYNIAENYFTAMTSTMSLDYNMVMGEKMKMGAKMKMVSDIQNVISRN